MPDPRIQAIGRAVPSRRIAQQTLLAHSPWPVTPLLERLFLESPVHSRGFFVPPGFYNQPRSLTETNAAWLRGSLALGQRAIEEALARSGHPPTSIDMIGVTTVTGYATPGLDLLLAKALGMRATLRRAHFNCIGCHAALPLLQVAMDHVRARPNETALTLAVEICSACLSTRDDPQNQVATSLFGDGAAAVVVGMGGQGPRLIGFGSRYDFDQMHTLGFGLDSLGFRIVLDPTIPKLIADHVAAAVDDLLRDHGVSRSQVQLWALHPGGSAILTQVGAALQLDEVELTPSRRVLRSHGNMSSPSVLFSLAEAMRSRGQPPSGYGVLAAFGPGLGIDVALVGFDS